MNAYPIPTVNVPLPPLAEQVRLRRKFQSGAAHFLLVVGPRDSESTITLGVIEEPDAQSAERAAQVLSAIGTAGGDVPTPSRLVAYARDATTLHPGLPTREAQAAARKVVLDLLGAVACAIGNERPIDEVIAALRADPSPVVSAVTGKDARAAGLPADPGGLTLAEYVERVWKPVAVKRPDWKKTAEGYWRRTILPALGHHRVRDLDHTIWFNFIGGLQKGPNPTRKTPVPPGPMSGAGKKNVQKAYAALLTHAEQQKHIPAMHKFYRVKGATKKVQPQTPLDRAQLAALVAAAAKGGSNTDGTMHSALFAVGGYCGLRPSEVRALRWEDIDLEARTLTILGAMDEETGERHTKTEASRATITLFAAAYAALLPWWEKQGRPTSGPVFTWRGEPLTSDAAYRNSIAACAKRAGIASRVTPYTLRHSFVTIAREGGVAFEDIMSTLRHTSPQMMNATYDHSAPALTTDRARFDAAQAVQGALAQAQAAPKKTL